MGPADEARKRLKHYFTIQCDDYHDPVEYSSLERAKKVVWVIRDRSTRDAGCHLDHWINEHAWRDGRYALIQIHEIDQVEPDRVAIDDDDHSCTDPDCGWCNSAAPDSVNP